jgi:hypothetical protein
MVSVQFHTAADLCQKIEPRASLAILDKNKYHSAMGFDTGSPSPQYTDCTYYAMPAPMLQNNLL